jgi:membrane-associated protein
LEFLKSIADFLWYLFELFLHLDRSLGGVIDKYQTWTYAFLFIVIFAETGFVVTPFLPGDSLLFAAGSFAALGKLNVHIIAVILIIAAVVGDSINYSVGRFIGPKIFEREGSRFLKKEHLLKTHQFYEKHGGITIILARFIPIIRTFAPFVAGIGQMTYFKFISYNIIGGVVWILLFVYSGYFFGNLPVVKSNFSFVVVAIIFISVLPMLFEYVRHKIKKA